MCAAELPDAQVLEIVTFYQIQRKAEQSVNSFYLQLKEQADKCGSFYCQDQIIRDRLIMTAPSIIQPLLHQQRNPTLDDVLRYLQHAETKLKAIALVLPYLDLGSIISLGRVDISIGATVDKYLESTGCIEITAETLSAYDINTHAHIYDKLRHCTELTLRAVPTPKMAKISAYLDRVNKLTLIDMKYTLGELHTPWRLSELTVIRCHLQETLQMLQHSYSRIRSLKLIGKCCDRTVNLCTMPCLQELFLDHPNNIVINDNQTLKRLTVRRWPTTPFRLPHSLNYLRVIEPVEPRVLDQLKDIKERDVFCYTPPKEQDLLLKLLDDDCLIAICQYLTVDCVALSRTHSRLAKVVFENGIRELDLSCCDYSRGEFWKKNGSFLMRIAKRLRKLSIGPKCSVTWLIPMCKNLISLHVIGCNFSMLDISEWPTSRVTDIRLQNCFHDNGDTESPLVGQYLMELQEVTSFHICWNLSVSLNESFLMKHRDTLTDIEIDLSWVSDMLYLERVLFSLRELRRFTQLTIVTHNTSNDYFLEVLNVLGPMLKILKIMTLDICVEDLWPLVPNVDGLEYSLFNGTYTRIPHPRLSVQEN